jgi:hypothetical protein
MSSGIQMLIKIKIVHISMRLKLGAMHVQDKGMALTTISFKIKNTNLKLCTCQ